MERPAIGHPIRASLDCTTTGAHAVLIIQLVRLNYMDKFEQFVENFH